MSEIILKIDDQESSSGPLVELDKKTILDITKDSLDKRYTINGLLKHIYNNFDTIINKKKYKECLINIRNKLELSELKKVYIVKCDSIDKTQEELERIKSHYSDLKYENSIIEFYRGSDLTTIEGYAKLEKNNVATLIIDKTEGTENEYFYMKIVDGISTRYNINNKTEPDQNIPFKNFCYHIVKNPFVQNEIGEYETTAGKIYELLNKFIEVLDTNETKKDITKYLQTKYYTKLLDRYREKKIDEETNLRKSKLTDFVTNSKISTKDDFTTNKIELYPYEKLNGKGGKIGNPRIFYDNIKQTKFIDKTLITNTLPFKLHSINNGEMIFKIKGLNCSKIPEKEVVVKPIFTKNILNISSEQLREFQKEYYGTIEKNKYLKINIGRNDIIFNNENNNEASMDGYLIIDKRQHLKDNKITKTYKKSNTGVVLDSKINSLFDDRDFVVCHKFFNDDDNGNKTIEISHTADEIGIEDIITKRWENLAILRKDEDGFYLEVAKYRTIEGNNKISFLNWIEPSSLKQIKFVRTNKFTFESEQVITELSELDYNKDQILFNVIKVKVPNNYYNYYKIYLKENIFDLNKIINEKVYITEFLQYGNFTTNYKLLTPDDPDLREILRYNKVTTLWHDKVFEMSEDNFDMEYNEKNLRFVGNGNAFYVGIVNGNTCTLYTTNQESTNQFCRITCDASIVISGIDIDKYSPTLRQ